MLNVIGLFYDRVGKNNRARLYPIPLEDFYQLLFRSISNLNNGFETKCYERYRDVFLTPPSLTQLQTTHKTLSKVLGISTINTKIEYYIDRGFPYEESVIKIKKRQSTNTLEAIRIKHNCSEDEAKEIHKKRQQKGIETVRSRSDYKDICKRKGWLNEEELIKKINPLTNNPFTIQEAKQSIIDWGEKHSICILDICKQKQNDGIKTISTTSLEYWLKRCDGDVIKSKLCLKERQNTRSLKKYISRYGEEDGTRRYHDVINRWLKTMDEKPLEEKERIWKSRSTGMKYYSRSSFLFFEKLKERLNSANIDTSRMMYGDNEWFLSDNGRVYFYDCKIGNIIIEYNGSHVHPNKQQLSTQEWENWMNPFTKETSDIVYKKDQHKLNVATKHGNEIYTVWDIDDEDDSIDRLFEVIELRTQNKC
jgi:hypothetical protein